MIVDILRLPMPTAFLLRCASLALTAAFCVACRDLPTTFIWATYSLGFAHYFLALRYSTRQVGQVLARTSQVLSLLGVAFLIFALYYDDFPLVAYFGVHHVLNEAYLQRSPAMAAPAPRRLQAASAAFHAAVYATVLRADPGFAWVEWAWAVPALVAVTALFVRELTTVRAAAPGARVLDLCGSELAAAVLLAASLFVRVTFLQTVLYHFVLWALLPVDRIRARGGFALAEYAGLSVALVAVAVLLSPLGPSTTQIGTVTFSRQFLFWSYAHITLSFALSDAHPVWVRRLFRGAGPAVAPATRAA